MSRLIEQLKKEHQFLVSRLGELNAIVGSTGALHALGAIKKGLLAHLGKEDDKLYPELNKAAESDRNLKDMLDNFSRDMQGITTAALQFFDKYEKGGTEGIEFAREFGALTATLAGRIHAEETILYPEYDKLVAKGLVFERMMDGDIAIADSLSTEYAGKGHSKFSYSAPARTPAPAPTSAPSVPFPTPSHAAMASSAAEDRSSMTPYVIIIALFVGSSLFMMFQR